MKSYILASDSSTQNSSNYANDYPASREKNARRFAVKAIYLIRLAMQVLEWRITAPNNKVKHDSGSQSITPDNELINLLMNNKHKDTEEIEKSTTSFPKTRLTWTGSKVEIVELIYALETAGCFNHGHATIKEIVTYIENVFNIDLNGYYRMFCDIKCRSDRTAFLAKLSKYLNKRIDEADMK